MSFHFEARPPGPLLAAFVESLWYAEGRVPYRRERVLPNGRPVLIINLGAPYRAAVGDARAAVRRKAWLVGTLSRFMTNEPLAETRVVGATLRPWSSGALMGAPGAATCGLIESADSLWYGPLEGLRDRLWHAPSPMNKLAVLEAALLARLSPPTAPGFALVVQAARLLESAQPPAVGALCKRLDVSRKHLNDLFHQHVGLAPKAFSDICRFKRTLSALAVGGRSLSELALAQGFYDQAHLNRDFARFGGLPPTVYLARRQCHFSDGDDPSGLFVPESAG